MSGFTFYAERPTDSYRKKDPLIVVSILLLWGLGLFTIFFVTPQYSLKNYSGKYHIFIKQLIWSGIGFGLMITIALVPMNFIRKMLPAFCMASLGLCLLALCFKGFNGARRWIVIGGQTFQPSELAKFAVILYLANQVSKNEEVEGREISSMFFQIVSIIVYAGVCLFQKDMSTAVLIVIVSFVLLFNTSKKVGGVIGFALLLIPATFMFIFSNDYRIQKVAAFLKPELHADGSSYQILTSQKAIKEGGFWGVGLGTGLDSIYKIPELVTDYIFSGWATAFGLVGVFLYFLLLGFFFFRAIKIAKTCPNRFAAVGTLGCALMITTQSLMNLAVVCGVMPTTGIPLPFFSTGGSSLIATFMMCGFMINACHCDAGNDFSMGKKYFVKRSNIESFNGVVVEDE